MKKNNLDKMLQEVIIIKTLEIKPNYSELSRKYKIDRRTIKKYFNGYEKKKTKDRKSKLDIYKDEIKEKLALAGATIAGVYQYFKDISEIGTYSNFYKYVISNNLRDKKDNNPNLRFETELGEQLQGCKKFFGVNSS